ncbi:MAG TPA: fatty acid desaturase, partial [Chryseosolibacter sp.]|nr:fatty acid desaturase [Chryseosolibacter sp.]
ENASKVTAIETQRLLLQRDTKEGRINLHPAYYLFFAQYMIFIRDFQMYFFSRASVPFSEYVKLFLWKTLYICLFVIAPLILIDLPLWLIAIALCLMYFVVTVISVFILLMPTEEMEHARYDGNNNIDDAWAAEVMRHNVDFSPDNRLVNALAGGANLNVIHYLFPSACHVLYSDLASLVETVSQKYSIYYRKQSLTDVVRIHIKYLTQIRRTSA